MARFVTLSADFRQTSLSFRDFLSRLQGQISTLNLNSIEVISDLKKNLLRSMKTWPTTLGNYKASILEMPKALRQRFFIQQSLKNIESFDKDFTRFLYVIKGLSIQDFRHSFDQNLHDLNSSLKAFKMRTRQMVQQVAALEEQALVQKFLSGETIFPGRKNIQWGRKLVHVSLGLFFLYLFVYAGLSAIGLWSVAGPLLGMVFMIEIIRHLNPRVNEWACHRFKLIMREHEKTRISSASFYILSILIVYFVFPIEVAILTLLFIAVGDPLAGIVGVTWGKRKITEHASWAGSMTCFVFSAVLSGVYAGFLFDHHLMGLSLIIFSLIGGMIAAFAEAAFKKLDDNLVMPLLSAPLLWVLMKLFSVL